MLAYSGPGGTKPAANKPRRLRHADRRWGATPSHGRRVRADLFPDGKSLAFTRITECGHAVCSGRIFIMPIAGGEARSVSELIGDPGSAMAWIS